jgi:multidrug efflux pump subunit AcrA (membrane-fusion protein)
MKISTILMKIKTFFTKKKIIWMVIILVLLFGGWLIFGNKSSTSNIQTTLVKQQDIEKTVLATGQVVSSTDLNLSWQLNGVVKKVLVKEGDVVFAGQLLAELDNSELVTQLHNAQAGLVIAEQHASASKNNLTNVTTEQEILVKNAYRTLLNSTLIAMTVGDLSASDAPTVSGTYTCNKEGTYNLKTYSSTGGVSVNYSGLEQGSFLLTDIPRPMGSCGLFLSFDKTKTLQSGIEFKIDVPNKNATNYNTNYNAYQLALQTRDTAIAGAQANVGTDSLVADAQIAQAH